MWIVANGAMKSGSTWLFQLFTATGRIKSIPHIFQDPAWSNPSVRHDIARDAADAFCSDIDYYVSKQHWWNRNSFLMGYPDVRIINIIRDIRDVVVSRYYHDVRTFGYQGDIETFLNEKLEYLINENTQYHSYWINAQQVNSNSYHVTSYEYMLENYEKAVDEIFNFSGIPLTSEQRSTALEKNLFKNKLHTGPGQFFRKGQAFSFAEDLSKFQEERILEMAEKNSFLNTKQKIAEFNPSLSYYLSITDIGI